MMKLSPHLSGHPLFSAAAPAACTVDRSIDLAVKDHTAGTAPLCMIRVQWLQMMQHLLGTNAPSFSRSHAELGSNECPATQAHQVGVTAPHRARPRVGQELA
jgi:hypothetical protein